MRTIIKFIIISTLLCSCAAVGTKTLYKTDEKVDISSLGYNSLDGDTILAKIYPFTNNIFDSTIIETLKEYSLDNYKSLDENITYQTPDIEKIKEICSQYNLDALLVSKLKFIYATQAIYFVPVSHNWDTEVEMKLFDKNGRLLYNTKHNTLKGNSYMNPPPVERTVHDGTKGALVRIFKNMGLIKTVANKS
ncbi:hypothetical protein [Maribellus luteus]|nr:hypothetical protein [Maribellus luteus]